MDLCRFTASLRCVSTGRSSCRAVAVLQQGAANSSFFLKLPVSSTLSRKALSVSVRCEAEVDAPTKPRPAPTKPKPVTGDDGSNGHGHGHDHGMNTSLLTSLYMDFLHSMSFTNSRDSCYPDRLDTVIALVRENGGSFMPDRYIVMGAAFGNLVYSLHPVDVQAKIGHFTALFLVVDDLAGKLTGAVRERYLEDIRLFQMKFADPEGYAKRYPGRGDLHEALEKVIVYLKTDQNPFFPAELRLHSLMIKSMLDFMEANLQEQHYEHDPIEYTADMAQLPRFLRNKSGIAELYAYFFLLQSTSSGSASEDEHFFYNNLYPMVPELIDVINFGNDVMSFYKEVLAGEDSIDIVNYSKIHNLPLLQSLRDSMESVKLSRRRLLALADRSGSDDIKDKLVNFFQGYWSWHLGLKRYRLGEVLRGWYDGGYWA
uniref:Terpine synthase-like protein MTPSL7 n=1 Tax=Anthoceros agrestis TaxID=41834 RepID=A0A2P1ED64_9EMBR|nr:terpine synthase-like protein MTPSL7 [Anthoceros agrestis]